MIYSLNEIDAHCKKAARGAGFAWGYAEDIGKTTRWLTAFELPGVGMVRQYLTQFGKSAKAYSSPVITSQNKIQSDQGNLCPIRTGCYLADVLSLSSEQEYSFERLGFPLLLLPFLSRIADQTQQSIKYTYDDNQFHYGGGKLISNVHTTHTCDYIEQAKCIFTSESVDGENASVVGQNVNENDWKRLNDYACKTYVPATEESRRGAGPSE